MPSPDRFGTHDHRFCLTRVNNEARSSQSSGDFSVKQHLLGPRGALLLLGPFDPSLYRTATLLCSPEERSFKDHLKLGVEAVP